MKQYWLTIKLKPHPTHPVTHDTPMRLKAYFDEMPPAKRSPFRAPAEKTSLQPLSPKAEQVFHFPLTKEEYNSGKFELFVWVEPYGSAALKFPGAMADKAVGRLKLDGTHIQRGGLPLPPPNSKPVDDQIVVETVELSNSVAQWTADQMNANAASAEATMMKKLSEQQRRMEEAIKEASSVSSSSSFLERLGAQQVKQSAASVAGNSALLKTFIMGRAGHPDDVPSQYGGWENMHQAPWSAYKNLALSGVLNTFLIGGGHLDLKKPISPIWGDFIRLGNREYYVTSDHFSNVHYGYVSGASGFTSHEANWLANLLGDDAPLDAHSTSVGLKLYHQTRLAKWSDIVALIEREQRLQTRK